VAVLGLGVAGTALADDSDLGEAACNSAVTGLEKDLARATLLGNIFAVSGAALAALGSAIAAASIGKKAWVAGAIGVVGAILTALPKTLADRAELQRRISLADQHRSHGEKTVLQIPLLQDKAFVDQCRQYAIARFVDCRAEDPPKEVPELPREAPQKKVAAGEPQGPQVVSRGLSPAPPPPKPPGGQRVFEHVEAIKATTPDPERERIMKH
jgi:hypothetical protein